MLVRNNKRIVLFAVMMLLCVGGLYAQQVGPKWKPEELKELFGYCEKPELVKLFKISPETADKIGEIHFWALQQKLSVEANTNPAYATPNEVEEDVVKKYKALKLSGEQVKQLAERRKNNPDGMLSCAVTTLTPVPAFDTLTPQKAIQLYKTKYRKTIIDKLDINGRQADLLFEAEVWKQKEILNLSALPENDFNRIRKTVEMHRIADNKFKAIGLTDQQLQGAMEFFRDNRPVG